MPGEYAGFFHWGLTNTLDCVRIQNMEILKEITEWNSDINVPNHVYLINKRGRVIAYENAVNGNVIKLNTGILIDKRYRKFIKVKHPELELIGKSFESEENVPVKKNPNVRTFKVKSKDKEYTVEYNGNFLSCNCTGFGFRRKCKHVDAVVKSLGL